MSRHDSSDKSGEPANESSSRVYKRSPHYVEAAIALGQRIRALRKANEWTLEVAADKMRIDLKHLQKIEAGTLNVTLVTLVRIAQGLRVPLASLFAIPDTPTVNEELIFDFVKKKLKPR